MPQQSDIGRIISALGGGLSTFAGAERLSREEKARRDAERIRKNMALAQFELQKHRDVQDIFGQEEARAFRTSEREARETFQAEQAGVGRTFQAEQSEINRALQRELTALRGEAKDPNIELARKITLEDKAVKRAEKKRQNALAPVIRKMQTLTDQKLLTEHGAGNFKKTSEDDAEQILQALEGRGLSQEGDLSRKFFQFQPDSAGSENLLRKELTKVGLGEMAAAVRQVKRKVRPVSGVGRGPSAERQQPAIKSTTIQGGTASETAKQIATTVRKQKGKISVKKLKALNKGQDVDAIIREVDRIMGGTAWRTK